MGKVAKFGGRWCKRVRGPSKRQALPAGPWRVFLSHTSELRRYPKRGRSYVDLAERAVQAAGHAVVNMADFPARDQTPAAYDKERVIAAEVYVGVYGVRYGTPAREWPDKSYTELEFDAATAAGKHRLIFIVDLDSNALGLPPKALLDPHWARQAAFLRRVREECGLLVKSFRSPEDLRGQVYQSLVELGTAEGAPAPGAQEPSPDAVPDLLPYAPDRHAQEVRMAAALKRLPASVRATPLVVILHGEEDQQGERFRERFLQHSLDTLLDPRRTARVFPLPWPKDAPLDDGFEAHFRQWMGHLIVQGESAAECGELWPDDPGPLVLWTSLYSDDWGRQGDRLLARLCRFWQESDVWTGCGLIHWITINYTQPTAYRSPIPWLRWLDGRYWERRLERRRLRRRNGRIRASLHRLERAHAGNTSPVILPELHHVSQADAESWARSSAVKTYLKGRSTVPLEDAVGRFYREQSAQRRQREIPMKDLSAFLLQSLPLAASGRL